MNYYQKNLHTITQHFETFPAPLREFAFKEFLPLLQGEFAEIVASLPHWLSDLLPLKEATLKALGLAHLYGWGYYHYQDQLLDGGTSSNALLVAHLMLLKMVDIYNNLGITNAPCWKNFHQLAHTSANAYAQELNTRFTSLAEVQLEQIALWNTQLILDRAAPLFFNTMAHFYLAGIGPAEKIHQDLLLALQHFTIARQIGDDASDWLSDLERGHLNYVSAQLIGRIYSLNMLNNEALDILLLNGHQIFDETFWRNIEKISLEHYQNALTLLPPCKLKTIIQKQMEKHSHYFGAMRHTRHHWRGTHSPI